MPIKSTGFIRPTFYSDSNSNVAIPFAELLMGNGNGLGGGGAGVVQLVQGDVVEFGFATSTPYFNSAFTRPSGVTDGYLPPPIDRVVDFFTAPSTFEPGTNYQYALRGFEFRFRGRAPVGSIQYQVSIGSRDTDVLPNGYFPNQFSLYGFGGTLINPTEFSTITVGGFGSFFGYDDAFADGNISGEFLRPQYWERGYGDSILGAQNGVVGQLNDYSGPRIRFEVTGEGYLELQGSSTLGEESFGFNIIYEEPDPFKIKIGENTKVVLSGGSSNESVDGGYSSIGSYIDFNNVVNGQFIGVNDDIIFGFASSINDSTFFGITHQAPYYNVDNEFIYSIPSNATNIRVHLKHFVYPFDNSFVFTYTFKTTSGNDIIKHGNINNAPAVFNTIIEDVLESDLFTPGFFNDDFEYLEIRHSANIPDSDTNELASDILEPGDVRFPIYFFYQNYSTPPSDPSYVNGPEFSQFKITYDAASEGLAGTKATLRAATGESVYDPYLEID